MSLGFEIFAIIISLDDTSRVYYSAKRFEYRANRIIPLDGLCSCNPDYLCALQKAESRSANERRIKENEEKEGVRHHLRTTGSAIILRPFEFSSFVITTNMRQMKRAKERGAGPGGEEEMEEIAWKGEKSR